MEEPMERGDREDSEEGDEGEPYGSQYLSEDEYLLEQYEDDVRDDDSDVVYLRAARVEECDLPRQEDNDVPWRWVYEDDHSVVHNHSCEICTAYKDHLAITRETGDDLSVENAIGIGQRLLHDEYIRGWDAQEVPDAHQHAAYAGRLCSLEPPDASLRMQIKEDVGMITSLMEGDHLLMEAFASKLEELKAMMRVERLAVDTAASPGEATWAMTDELPPSREFRYTLRKPEAVGVRPPRDKASQQCLAAFVEINGFRAYTLFDSGSMTDSVSPQTTWIAKLPYFTLENPVTLQLGCVGSRSQINYGTDVVVGFAGKAADTYVDVVNMDCYNAILGA
ncbi:hypothetical protein BV22DRAFT_1135357 [Leucogyrophana mollusca]|uniref:Uncharacterized protein n=1 Tax=Leucogyrophana mollusca TaxID=85980 RepID=A0ACB8AWZ7_9AGAM|nr:hypothetical protein BV22DRAFT_1135357 [Leucogyrophana mollusca]